MGLVVGASAGALAQSRTVTNSAYAEGQRAFAQKDYRAAIALFAVAAEAEGRSPGQGGNARLQEAKCQINLGDFAGAEVSLQNFLRTRAPSAEALYLLGFVLQRQNRPRESLEVFTRAAALQTPTGNDLRLAALDYVLLEDYPDALRWLARSVAADPSDPEAWYDQGRAQMHQGDFEGAVKSFQRTLVLQAHHVKALDNLGLSLEALNRQEEALVAYAEAVRSTEASAQPMVQPLLDEGTLLNTRNEFGVAAPLLERGVSLAPGNARCFEELARARTGLGQAAAARVAMERAVALDPTNSRLHFQLGRIYRDAGLAEKAREEFRRSATLYGQHATPEGR